MTGMYISSYRLPFMKTRLSYPESSCKYRKISQDIQEFFTEWELRKSR